MKDMPKEMGGSGETSPSNEQGVASAIGASAGGREADVQLRASLGFMPFA